MRRELIGKVGVDSGKLIITDPVRINQNLVDEVQESMYQSGFNNKSFDQLHYNTGHPGLAVIFSSGLGDGVYNVYATFEDIPDWGERITKVEIELIQED
ncbi:hypothetical protein GCM10010965_14530 [Caldalkalibacillus thermarum]|uniref:hypothetical protein n=1 Tax=Caldalkalibacillus thermarum TaxID=296745 RepID=UPI00166648B9|nr:hypothetical protein [Caldalkalibacillus thermarum]GGK22713.1 hypothetical protein GCM10010965_14530 [Caldalkalibacillus thermarum]